MAQLDVLKEVAALRTDLTDIERFLDECEKKGSKKALADAALRMKNVAPRLKNLKGDPSTHTPEILKLISDLNNGFKAAFQRAKTLKEASDRQKAAETSAPIAVQTTVAAAVPTTQHKEPEQPKKQPQQQPTTTTTTTTTAVVATKSNPEDEMKARAAKEAEEAAARAREQERQRKRELEQAIANDSEKKRTADSEARTASDKKERREQMAMQARQVSAAADDEGEEGGAESKSGGSSATATAAITLALPGMREGRPGKDIWAMLQKLREEQRKKEASEAQSDEHTVIFVGGKSSGKSTLVAGFLDKQIEREESTALEYSYGRRTRGTTMMGREVVHCWEIAGGTRLASLLEVCLTPEHIDTTSVVLVVDLSDPSRMMEVVLRWTEAIRARVEHCLKTLAKLNPAKREALSKAAAASLPASHPDRAAVRGLGVPALLVGTKYDRFQDVLEAEQRKVVSRTLRYVAHANCMSLLFVVARDEGKHMTRFRAHMNNTLFGSPVPEAPVTAYTKPVVVPRWQDTFESIGKLSASAPESGSSAMAVVMQAWREMFDRVFPPSKQEDSASDDTATTTTGAAADDDSRYRETIVDSVVAEKEQEFARNERLLSEATTVLSQQSS